MCEPVSSPPFEGSTPSLAPLVSPILTKVCMCVEVNTWRLEIASELRQLWEAGGGGGRSIEHCTDAGDGKRELGNFFERVYCLTFDREKLCRCANGVDAEKNDCFFKKNIFPFCLLVLLYSSLCCSYCCCYFCCCSSCCCSCC